MAHFTYRHECRFYIEETLYNPSDFDVEAITDEVYMASI